MFQQLTALPADPLLGIAVAYRQDDNPKKVDLGVGVYKTEEGNTPILTSVKKSLQILLDSEESKSYIQARGNQAFLDGMEKLVLGADNPLLSSNRVESVQAPGGTGSLKLGFELIKRGNPNAKIWVSGPTWANHNALIKSTGLASEEYPYYDKVNNQLRADEMLEAFAKLGKDDVVLLHGCCHNPTGEDIPADLWPKIADLAVENGFTPFIDIAYQGFGTDLETDVQGVRHLLSKVPEALIATSCSKNFGLYRERTGLITTISESPVAAGIALTHVLNIAREIYSMPPSYGGATVGILLGDEALTTEWKTELAEMCARMRSLRALLVDKLHARDVDQSFDFINRQNGMFTFLGITPEQVQAIRDEYSIYMAGSSRINIAGISNSNVDYIADAVAAVLKK
ncbi:aromatic amino acid transaminase [Catenovulum adriaticum]|uniref:Aspartate/tyrosine/aromatic aminotransferase n=1 Tax=Catenovulum adriaticum TaxID=2984846 RepID=A0ABY7ATD2_9ALTE|nr:amino acid aminotransferase [Catenovulum sp. TS8]WAJ71546.1 aspartate/tyrosine/aromatic aminotransferase [Catenovulum sp. TS8]